MAHVSFAIIFYTFSLFVCARATTEEAKGKNVIFDMSQIIRDVLHKDEKTGKAENALKNVIKQNIKGLDQYLMYYQTDEGTSSHLEIHDIINILYKMRKEIPEFHPKLLLSIKDITGQPADVNATVYIRQNYDKIFSLIADHSSTVVGLFIHAFFLENDCKYNGVNSKIQHPLTSIISQTQKYISTSSHFKIAKLKNTLKLGYEVRINDMKCRAHHSNIKNADILVTKFSIKRNDNYFVESYGFLKQNLESEISQQLDKDVLENKTVYLKISLTATLERGPLHAFIERKGNNKGENIYNEKEEKWLNSAKDGLVSLDVRTARRYENLLVEYMRVLTRNNAKGRNIVVKLHGYPYFEGTESFTSWKERAERIPYISNLHIRLHADKFPPFAVSLQDTTNIFLRDIASAGFKTVMITGKSWDMLFSWIGKFSCNSSESCLPRNVVYLIEDNEQLNKIQHAHGINQGKDGINVGLLVFSHGLDAKLEKVWGKVVNSFQIANVTPACQILTRVFEDHNYNNPCSNINACNAVRLHHGFYNRCTPMQNIPSTVIWVEMLHFDKLDHILKRLDSYVIAREILLKDFPNNKVILQFKGETKGNSSPTGSSVMYCNTYDERIGNFYEAILTWSLIHEFHIILEPEDGKQSSYNNPLAWKPLEVESSNSLHQVIKASPLFIRRSYTKSKAFESWNKGMYPCITRATTEKIKTRLQIDNRNIGVTLNLRVRQDNNHLSRGEVQTLLLFSLGTFSTVEISLQQNNFNLLKDALFLSDLKINLQINQISGKTVYLQLPKECAYNDVTIINEIMSGFTDAGLHINVHGPSDCLNYTVSGAEMGHEFDYCDKLVLSQTIIKMSPEISYIVCSLDVILAYNRNEKQMQDYLDSHLYMSKILQYIYPNLKRIFFRFRPTLGGISTLEQIENLMMFLSDINNYAKSYNIHYFILPAFPTENSRQTEASFWNITSYWNLTDVSVYQEYQSEYLNETTWVPNFANGSEVTSSNLTGGRFGQFALVAGSTLPIVCIFIVAIIVYRRRSRRLSKEEIQEFYTGHQVTLKKAVDERRNNQYTVNIFDGLVFQKNYEISKEEIILHEKVILGNGKFSTVHLATMQNELNTAAVKIANKGCSKIAFKGMLSEVKLLCYIGDHVNVIKFLGCYTKDIEEGVLWIVTELCKGGPLQVFLRNSRGTDSIETKDMINFSLEIASGMEYITKQKIIHGNLCTSSVLLDVEGKHCKIYGCGGLWRKMGDNQIFLKRNKRPSKWQWMAPELLECLTYSTKSDVWSFGVTVWEIFTLGDIPFSKVSWSPKFVDDLKNGLRLQMPPLASKEIFGVILDCCEVEVSNRPDFCKLVHKFSNLLEKVHYN